MAVSSRKQPLYDQLVDALRDKIENDMDPGDLLPSERELTELYGVSRTTVRLALAELVTLGLVTRRHGKGTFVSELANSSADLTNAYSFTEEMRRLGRVPKTEVLEFGLVAAPKHVSAHLGVKLGAKVFRMRRLRMADGVPLMIERSYLPAQEFISLTRTDVETKPLYDIIEKDYQHKIRVAEEEFRASTARPDEAKYLRIAEGAPVLRLSRVTTNDRNVVVEYTHSAARADQFKYKIVHLRSQG
ncbi:GntR family transcriptional regulator [Olsenella massiliensis]|uniref:GntR family transcriptional regulator n=1 Tax=Olsenella massiliensis TaxID=1622075 RepID=UPI00071C375E|nr:GntR family transcriptional regulator [Olsenella massiliensis]